MKLPGNPRILGTLVAAGLATASVIAVAAVDPGVALKQRKAVMGSMAAHLGGIKAGVAAGNNELVESHATAINGLASIIPTLFPEGSGQGDTRAKPEIWQNWSEFESAAGRLGEESAKLAEVAKGGDKAAIAAQFAAVGKNGCGGCHNTFRKPKE